VRVECRDAVDERALLVAELRELVQRARDAVLLVLEALDLDEQRVAQRRQPLDRVVRR
jgi:hypothetical protein